MAKIRILGAALIAAGALWAVDSNTVGIEVNRVQQRYPWNGMVDIDFTVTGVTKSSDYYVRFKLIKSEGAQELALHEFLDDQRLVTPVSEANQRVTWNSAWENSEYRMLAKNAKIRAELVYCGGDKHNSPYGARYAIVDLSWGGGTEPPNSFPVTYTNIWSFAVATNLFNRDEYKTDKLVLRRLHGGTFTQGAPASELPDEGKRAYMALETPHQVTLTKNFLIGVFPLTRRQYHQVMGTHPAYWDNGGEVEGRTGCGMQPACALSYADIRGAVEPTASPAADSFMDVLRRKTNLNFDLPTDAQWEYACRAGTTTATYAGDYTADGPGNTNMLSRIAVWSFNRPGEQKDMKPGTKEPNDWGLYDMFGLVVEIIRDHASAAYPRRGNYGYCNGWSDPVFVPPQVDPAYTEKAVGGVMPQFRGGTFSHSNCEYFRAAAHMYKNEFNSLTAATDVFCETGLRVSATLD